VTNNDNRSDPWAEAAVFLFFWLLSIAGWATVIYAIVRFVKWVWGIE